MADGQGDWADRAVQMAAAMGRRTANELRKLAPKPFGLINQKAELATSIGSYAQGYTTEGLAGNRQEGEPAPLRSMTLCYGTPDDPQSPWIEVFTDFTANHEDTVSVRYALGKAVSCENARLAGELEHSDPLNPPPGPLERGQLQIVVAGQSRTVRTQSYERRVVYAVDQPRRPARSGRRLNRRVIVSGCGGRPSSQQNSRP
jgi:hypothetical protein